MSADLPLATGVFERARPRPSLDRFAERALNATTRLWFLVTIAGQLVFAFAVASFYGRGVVSGDLEMWNRFTARGHIAGDAPGNAAVAMHLASAVLILLAGALQFVPQFRTRFPAVHRWSGRTYILSAFALSLAGVYMHWFRGPFGDLPQHIGGTLNAVLIWLSAAMALRYAMARNFRVHRRWALRLFLLVSASWFFRVTFFLWIAVVGPYGFDPATFTGPFLTIMTYAQYLVPLALLELYFFVREHPGTTRRLAMAGTLLVLTLGISAGTLVTTAANWLPSIKVAFDSRKSIASELFATIASHDVDAAIRRYRELRSQEPTVWNFDEPELNRLGYQLLRANRIAEAIRIFQLNVEIYPQSSNVYDSLGEAYLLHGDNRLAIANYARSLQLNPKNRGAVVALQKLGAR